MNVVLYEILIKLSVDFNKRDSCFNIVNENRRYNAAESEFTCI